MTKAHLLNRPSDLIHFEKLKSCATPRDRPGLDWLTNIYISKVIDTLASEYVQLMQNIKTKPMPPCWNKRKRKMKQMNRTEKGGTDKSGCILQSLYRANTSLTSIWIDMLEGSVQPMNRTETFQSGPGTTATTMHIMLFNSQLSQFVRAFCLFHLPKFLLSFLFSWSTSLLPFYSVISSVFFSSHFPFFTIYLFLNNSTAQYFID